MSAARAVRVGLIDMNNGVPNQGVRCFRSILDRFFDGVLDRNPGIEIVLDYVQPRNLGEVPSRDCDLYLSTGGPGSPFDGYEEPWCTAYRRFLDDLVDESIRRGEASRALLVVCHSFEIAVLHFGIAQMAPRASRKFGVMPVYPTELGTRSALFSCFGDRLFAWEHRSWQAVDLDESRLGALGGELWARESRDGFTKGEGLLAFRFAPGIEGTQFHPEADRAGAVAWIARPEQAAAVIEAFGELTYRRMLKTLDDPDRLARTFALMIPGWLVRGFNALAPVRGWKPLDEPAFDPAAPVGWGSGPLPSIPPPPPAGTPRDEATLDRPDID
jgi:GMP synthase-like glutamine amidotransferase